MQALHAQLNKVDQRYSLLEEALQIEVSQVECHGFPVSDQLQRLSQARRNTQELTQFASLNYSAVLKAVKKRNRRLQLACGDSAITAASSDFLADKSFFKSTTLAHILHCIQTLSEVCLRV